MCCSVKSLYVIASPSAWVCCHPYRVNMSCYSWFMFRGNVISFVLIQNLACYTGDPKHVYYNENRDYFHNSYWGTNKVLLEQWWTMEVPMVIRYTYNLFNLIKNRNSFVKYEPGLLITSSCLLSSDIAIFIIESNW